MSIYKLLPLVGIGLASTSSCTPTHRAIRPTATRQPNIIFILCDDLGYGDVGSYGQKLIATPQLDSMAARGMRFTNAYAGSPVSAPSRACLMTGQHTGHTHVRGNKEYRFGKTLFGSTEEPERTGQEPYDTAHILLPELLRDNGYTTAVFGKWAGGYEGSVSTPKTRGVDEFYGYMCQFQAHAYYPNFLNAYSRGKDADVYRDTLYNNIKWSLSDPEEYRQRRDYSADMIHRRALRWIGQQDASKPFVAFLTYTLPHAELYQPQDSIVKGYRHRFVPERSFAGSPASRYVAVEDAYAQFAAQVTRLDTYVGEVIATLQAQGLADNTLVIFTSDNGPHLEGGADPSFFGSSGPLRGTKRSTHEGGIRVPFIAYWPGKVPAGRVSETPIAFYDVLPTLCELAGIDDYIARYRNPLLGDEDHFDGISFAPTLLGQEQRAQHDFLYFEFAETDEIAVRSGKWKLIVKRGIPELYNLEEDLHEDNNLVAQHPEVVARLVEIVRREHKDSPTFRVTLPQ